MCLQRIVKSPDVPVSHERSSCAPDSIFVQRSFYQALFFSLSLSRINTIHFLSRERKIEGKKERERITTLQLESEKFAVECLYI